MRFRLPSPFLPAWLAWGCGQALTTLSARPTRNSLNSSAPTRACWPLGLLAARLRGISVPDRRPRRRLGDRRVAERVFAQFRSAKGHRGRASARQSRTSFLHRESTLIYPHMMAETRPVANNRVVLTQTRPGGRDIDADVKSPTGTKPQLCTAVAHAVKIGGSGRLCFSTMAKGVFELRAVKLGADGDGRTRVKEGLAEKTMLSSPRIS